MKTREWMVVSCAVMFFGSEAFAQGNLIVNGSFESPTVANGAVSYFSSISGWRAVRGCDIEIQNHISGWNAENGNQLVELASSCLTTIAQSISTTPGAQYLLSFSYSPRPGVADNRIRVRWGGVVVTEINQSGVGLYDTRWATVSLPVSATSYSYVLEFEATSSAIGLGGFIDNVQLVQR